jgi:hypothetical protein
MREVNQQKYILPLNVLGNSYGLSGGRTSNTQNVMEVDVIKQS